PAPDSTRPGSDPGRRTCGRPSPARRRSGGKPLDHGLPCRGCPDPFQCLPRALCDLLSEGRDGEEAAATPPELVPYCTSQVCTKKVGGLMGVPGIAPTTLLRTK